jgi:hypothetical protein
MPVRRANLSNFSTKPSSTTSGDGVVVRGAREGMPNVKRNYLPAGMRDLQPASRDDGR